MHAHCSFGITRWTIENVLNAYRCERDAHLDPIASYAQFQSALPVWGAMPPTPSKFWSLMFQSALPVWGAIMGVALEFIVSTVSIRAPRVGSDALGRYRP